MSKASIPFESFEKELLQDEEVKMEYENLKPRYDIISQMIKIRNEEGITQEELARRIGTKKSNISRMESGNYNPSLDFKFKMYFCILQKRYQGCSICRLGTNRKLCNVFRINSML